MKTDISAQWDKFFNRYYIGDILALANEYPEIRSLYVDFVNIEKFDPDLADELLAHPDQILSTAEEALRNFDLPIKKTLAGAHLRITNIPQKVKIRDLRSIHISKLIAIEGLVRMATEVRPRLLVAAFECNGCGETMLVPQSSGRFVEPYMCKNEGCGRKGPFKIKLTESEFVDAQKLRVQESPEDMRGGEQPQTLDVNSEDDIAGIVAPGDHVIVAGILRSYQRITREGKSTFFDIILDSASIETKDKEFTEIEITAEEEEEIVKLSEDPGIYKKIIASIAPSIYGYEEVKEALALQLMSGVPKNLPDGARVRGDVHVLLVGDPGIAKSQLLRYIRKLAPRGIYTSGRSSSAAGLCVSPDTLIQTSDGFFRIGKFVEARMQNPVQVEDGIWKSNCNSVSLSTVDSNHTITENPLVAVWRIRAPDTMMRIETESGRSITVTPTTPLPVMTDHGIGWVRSADLTDQQYLATPRLLPENRKVPYTIELFESNCTVLGASGVTTRIVSRLKKRYGTIRDAASALKVSEDSLYYNWTNEDARGNPDLRTLMRLAEHVGIEFDEIAQSCCQFSQQHGHKITLPVTPDEDFMYFAGLIAGDGSISKAKHAAGSGGPQIRFSNSDEHLLERYASIITELFGIDCSRSDGSNVRPPDIRFGSKIIAEILYTLGVPASPKSSKISLPDVVLNLPNNLIAAYLRGLFDTDGSCAPRQTGSSSLQLYTASKQLAEGVLLALLKFGIIGRIRVRLRDGATSSFTVDSEVRTITTSSDIYVVTIYGRENITRYHDRIDFEHPLKHGNLVKILKSYKNGSRSTNVDRVPHVGSRLKTIRQHFGLPATIYSNNGNNSTTRSSSIGGGNGRSSSSGSGGMAAERGVYLPTPQHLQSLLLRIKERIKADDWQGTRILLPYNLRDSVRELLHKNTTNTKLAQALNMPKTTSSEYFYRQSRDIAVPYRVLARFSDLIRKFDRDTADAIRESISDVVAKEPEMKAELDALLQLSTGDVFFDKVRSTEEIRDHGYEHVYDLTISGTHNFVANSMLTHNTAAAVRDEFGDGRWTLEAGALVLADQGIAAVDEMDKMRSEDRSAIHEAMEQQSYHPSTEIIFSDGRKVGIGEFVDALIENNRNNTVDGVDCEILPFDGNCDLVGTEILTLNSDNNICQTPINRVSRHKAPDHFIQITYSNGRSITVTPEHPVYVLQNGEIVTVLADMVEAGAFAPIPTKYPLVSSEVALQIPDLRQRAHDSRYTEISFPTHLNSDFGRLLGHIVSEGHVCYSEKNNAAEVMISNADLGIINDVDDLIRRIFDAATSIRYQRYSVRKNANVSVDDEAITMYVYTVRCASIPLYEFMKLNFGGVAVRSDENRIPDQIFVSYDDVRIEFLIGAFRGDGFCDSERFGYATNSINLANDYSDLLLCLGIYSCITSSDEYGSNRYKVAVSGYGSRQKFYDVIGKHDLRNRKIKKCTSGRKSKLNDCNRVPVDVVIRIKAQLKGYRLEHGHLNKTIAKNKEVHRKVALKYLNTVEAYLSGIRPHEIDEMVNPREIRKKYWIPTYLIAEQMGISDSLVRFIERNPSAPNRTPMLEQIRRIAKANIEASREEVKDIKRIIESDIRFTTVKAVSRVRNDGFDWVYDVTVEPDHTFVSNGLILHNTVSIAKAGIMATLKSRCSLLGAANPKYGRFDPYEGIAQQIKMAPALLSRFDLIFVLKDEPDISRDSAIASHILGAHHAGELHAHRTNVSGSGVTQADVEGAMTIIKPEIMPDLLRKYIAYAKRGVYPIMESDAMDRLIEFYLGLRRQGEDRDSPVPVTARQLEALVRLCEASARLRLSYEATIEDAERVIRVVESCLRQVAFDAETGMFDADLITTGVSKSQRDKFKILRGIIRDIASEHGGMASRDDIYAMAEEQGFDREHVEEMLGRLKTQGELYEPTQGNVRLS
ncbi:MAG: LAGLIDADG family homing endonuclease [Euryarchaeota archaeon]|nr:LAGLIDADG family homing endonuclease [Euryarchaeota archaeon]